MRNLKEKMVIHSMLVCGLLGALVGCAHSPSPSLSVIPDTSPPQMGAILYSGTHGVIGSIVRLRLEEDVNVSIQNSTESKRSGALSTSSGFNLPFVPEWLSGMDAKANGSVSHSSSYNQKNNRHYVSEVSGIVVEERGLLSRVQVTYQSIVNGNSRTVTWSGWFNKNALGSGRVMSSNEAADVRWEER